MEQKQPNSNQALQVFSSPQFGQIRTAGTSEQPLFCLADIGRVLEIKNVRGWKSKLKQEGVVSIYTHTESGEQWLTFINEQNLYKLIMRSDKPQAEAFQDWVCGKVLPSIRKNGSYDTQAVELFTPENMLLVSKAPLEVNAQLKSANLQIAAAEREIDRQRAEIDDKQQMIDAAVEEIQERDSQINEMQPFADYAKQTLESKSDYTFSDVAKDLGLRSANAFQDWAKSKGVLFKQGERWLPVANVVERGWFTSRTFSKRLQDGSVLSRVYTTVTERGRAALHFLMTHSRKPSEAELNQGNAIA